MLGIEREDFGGIVEVVAAFGIIVVVAIEISGVVSKILLSCRVEVVGGEKLALGSEKRFGIFDHDCYNKITNLNEHVYICVNNTEWW